MCSVRKAHDVPSLSPVSMPAYWIFLTQILAESVRVSDPRTTNTATVSHSAFHQHRPSAKRIGIVPTREGIPGSDTTTACVGFRIELLPRLVFERRSSFMVRITAAAQEEGRKDLSTSQHAAGHHSAARWSAGLHSPPYLRRSAPAIRPVASCPPTTTCLASSAVTSSFKIYDDAKLSGVDHRHYLYASASRSACDIFHDVFRFPNISLDGLLKYSWSPRHELSQSLTFVPFCKEGLTGSMSAVSDLSQTRPANTHTYIGAYKEKLQPRGAGFLHTSYLRRHLIPGKHAFECSSTNPVGGMLQISMLPSQSSTTTGARHLPLFPYWLMAGTPPPPAAISADTDNTIQFSSSPVDATDTWSTSYLRQWRARHYSHLSTVKTAAAATNTRRLSSSCLYGLQNDVDIPSCLRLRMQWTDEDSHKPDKFSGSCLSSKEFAGPSLLRQRQATSLAGSNGDVLAAVRSFIMITYL
ncbi:hypothetical protein EVG20_g1989 [Dentipellis fragilis]|uniref:Uncharacterized protein n=1 Tax=Dentipellis fragilis TaxID=205917 RepID=A0A4Y9Z8Y3_9AGAM|nr:hypothetical protein EVG20_g1989 [Dentipellis fragilis]